MPVFDRVATPRIYIYDGKTNEYYGRAIFTLTTSVESALLGMINNATIPNSILLVNVTFYPASSKYVPPGAFNTLPRNGVIHAEFRDANSKLWTHVEINLSFDSLTRGKTSGDKYYFDSVEYTNIKIQDIKILPQGERHQESTTEEQGTV